MKKILLILFPIVLIVYASLVGYNYINKKKARVAHQKELINQHNKIIAEISIPSLEMKIKKNLDDLKFVKKSMELDKNLILTKYEFLNGFYSGIHEVYPGSGYLDFHNENLFVVSARGIIAYKNLKDDKQYSIMYKKMIDLNDSIDILSITYKNDKEYTRKLVLLKNLISELDPRIKKYTITDSSF